MHSSIPLIPDSRRERGEVEKTFVFPIVVLVKPSVVREGGPPAGGPAGRGDGVTCCTDGFCIFVSWRWQNKFAFPFQMRKGASGACHHRCSNMQQSSLDAVRVAMMLLAPKRIIRLKVRISGNGKRHRIDRFNSVRPPHCASSRNGNGRHVAVISSLQIVLISAAARSNHLVAVPKALTRSRTCTRHVELRSFENCFLNLFSPQEPSMPNERRYCGHPLVTEVRQGNGEGEGRKSNSNMRFFFHPSSRIGYP